MREGITMKTIHGLMVAVCLSLVFGAHQTATADPISYYRVNMWADADPYGDSYPTLLFDETEGATSASLDTGLRTGYSGSTAEAAASADLPSGALRVYVGAKGASNNYYEGYANASASFTDSVQFDLPDGVTSAEVAVSFTVEGIYELFQASNSTTGADASLWFYKVGETGYLFRDDVTIYDGYTGSGTGIPHTISGVVTVEEGSEYRVYAMLAAGVRTRNGTNVSYFDFSNTGTLAIDTPAGVSFTSGSGVLLIPEPASAAFMWVAGAAMLARRRR
jgi:hypothetical protein